MSGQLQEKCLVIERNGRENGTIKEMQLLKELEELRLKTLTENMEKIKMIKKTRRNETTKSKE